ncbi:MAG: hypothetical protein VB070_08025 [Clostridiaceae bacterium]|nr:hypothetical protein [Clostridiaceae bacterium]
MIDKPVDDSLESREPATRLSRKKPVARRRFIVIAGLILLIAAAVIFIWQLQNQATAQLVIGRWYCVDDGILYEFSDDGSFNAKIGQLSIWSGSWKAGWQKQTLIIDGTKDGSTVRMKTPYILSNENKEMQLTNFNEKILNMNRQKDE